MKKKIDGKSTAFRQAMWQAPLLVLVSVALSLAVNHMRKEGLPLVGDWSVETRFIDTSGESHSISLGGSLHLFERDEAVFLDARPESQYAEGHIKGAFNLPWQDLDRYFLQVIDKLDGPKTIITYCDGAVCDLSHELTLFLKEMGFEKVYVLVNGWSLWKEAGLPVERGLRDG